MLRQFLIIIISLFSFHGYAQIPSWPVSDSVMKVEPKPYKALPKVVPTYGIATLKGHLVNGYQLPDSVSIRFFMGSDIIMKSKVDSTGGFIFHVPVARTCGAFIDNRCYVFLSPDDTLEVWLSQKSPLLKRERKIFARGPFASLISDINNERSQYDVLREHLVMESSDVMDYISLEKSVTDMIKTVANCADAPSPLVMDEILLVCRNPNIVYSRYLPDVLRIVRQYNILTDTTFSKELKFYEMSVAIKRNEPFDLKELDTLPVSYKLFLIDTFQTPQVP